MTTCIAYQDTLAKRVWPGTDSTPLEHTTPTWMHLHQDQYAQHAYRARCDRPLRTIFVYTVCHLLATAVNSHLTRIHIHTGHRPVISTAISSRTYLQDEVIHASRKTGELQNLSKASPPSSNHILSGSPRFQAQTDSSEPMQRNLIGQLNSFNAFTTSDIDLSQHHLATNMQMESQNVQQASYR